jgi:hypothetical protein
MPVILQCTTGPGTSGLDPRARTAPDPRGDHGAGAYAPQPDSEEPARRPGRPGWRPSPPHGGTAAATVTCSTLWPRFGRDPHHAEALDSERPPALLLEGSFPASRSRSRPRAAPSPRARPLSNAAALFLRLSLSRSHAGIVRDSLPLRPARDSCGPVARYCQQLGYCEGRLPPLARQAATRVGDGQQPGWSRTGNLRPEGGVQRARRGELAKSASAPPHVPLDPISGSSPPLPPSGERSVWVQARAGVNWTGGNT